MYRVFYGFKGIPFYKDIKAEDLYMNQSLKEAMSRFDYLKKYRGIMLLTGEPGTGKTTALRYFLSTLNNETFFPTYIPLSTVGVTDFYRQLNDKLRGESLSVKSAMFRSIQQRILDLAVNQNRVPVVVIDEAHFLKNENFFELQIITNFKMDSLDPCLFILSAQNYLAERLSRPILKSFNQRISMKYHLSPLSPDECKKYIIHTLSLHEVSPDIFTDPAYRAISNISHGIIRMIGKLTVKTLSYGAGLKKTTLNEEDVFKASKEL